ncbi:hypothetical protein HRI_003492300 [Hibiscus trionum]|uniref:Peptidase metallopeptidase domain-containing protein n=1 Tax=Hibiscus trionum TaxID=183268 RepID=A0A9W7IN99_HIBTR|nr:hypothetical protein HRI_003492300 [Hibiscus trionum]
MAAKFGLDHKLLGTFLMFLVLQPFAATSRIVKPASLQNLEPGQHRGCGISNIIVQTTFNGTEVDDFKFFPGNLRWTNFPVTYGYVPGSSVPNGLTVQAVIAAVEAAFKVWEGAVPKFAFKKANPGDTPNIKIQFTRLPGRYYGYGYAPPNGLVSIDNDHTYWSAGSTPKYYELDLQSGLMHEFGHALGLDHSTDQSAVMNDTLIAGTTKRVLAQDDKDGIQKLYA